MITNNNSKPIVRRRSAQRERILELVAQARKHPSALQIYDELRKEFPRLSLGNVYRNLGILVEQGRIEALDLGHGLIRYDAALESHYHFVCRRCGRVYDLPARQHQRVDRMMQGLSSHRIENYVIKLQGTCASCQSKKNNGTNKNEGD